MCWCPRAAFRRFLSHSNNSDFRNVGLVAGSSSKEKPRNKLYCCSSVVRPVTAYGPYKFAGLLFPSYLNGFDTKFLDVLPQFFFQFVKSIEELWHSRSRLGTFVRDWACGALVN